MCCLSAPSPPTFLIYELPLDLASTDFGATHFDNVSRIVFLRTGIKPAAMAVQHENNWRVSVASTLYNVSDVNVDRPIIVHLIPWHLPLRDIKGRGWQPTLKYFHLMIDLDPKWIKDSTDNVHVLALWEAYYANGLPRTDSPAIDVNAWHGVTQRIANATADFVPRVFINEWEPTFPITIKAIGK
jgi:hypothetical protein